MKILRLLYSPYVLARYALFRRSNRNNTQKHDIPDEYNMISFFNAVSPVWLETVLTVGLLSYGSWDAPQDYRSSVYSQHSCVATDNYPVAQKRELCGTADQPGRCQRRHAFKIRQFFLQHGRIVRLHHRANAPGRYIFRIFPLTRKTAIDTRLF